MRICIFEDDTFANFFPLTLSRPVYDLLCGISTLREKVLAVYPGTVQSFLCRAYLADTIKEENPGIEVNSLPAEDTLFINGRIIASMDTTEQITLQDKTPKVYRCNGMIAAVRLPAEIILSIDINNFYNSICKVAESLPTIEVNINKVDFIWDLISYNGKEIVNDFVRLTGGRGSRHGKIYDGVTFVNEDMIHVDEGSVIKPGVVIDAEDGPVYIGKNVKVFPNSVFIGPAFIGDGSNIKTGAAIYENTSIGKVCKIGGEVEDIVVLPYSNKQHAGFIGHAYLGSWVNLGADTNCSDLKNNYSTIRAAVNGKEVDTGLQFLGLIMGDHSKTAINTMFNTGTFVGFSSNIFGSGFPMKYIPSFSWGGSDGFVEYNIEKSIHTASKVMGRRKIEMTETTVKLFHEIFNLTKDERIKKI